MESLTYPYKYVLRTYAGNLHEGPWWVSSMYSLSTTPLITLPYFPLLNRKLTLQVEFLNDTLVHMQLELLKIGTFRMFKTKFENL